MQNNDFRPVVVMRLKEMKEILNYHAEHGANKAQLETGKSCFIAALHLADIITVEEMCKLVNMSLEDIMGGDWQWFYTVS